MADVLERDGASGARPQAVTDDDPARPAPSPAQFEGQYDPHVWFDVALWMLAVEQVRDTPGRARPRQRARSTGANAAAYLARAGGAGRLGPRAGGARAGGHSAC